MDVSDARLQPLRDAVTQQHLEDLVQVQVCILCAVCPVHIEAQLDQHRYFALQVMDVRHHAAAAATASPALPGFDRVLVDVPCSGTGVLAKRADMRWRRQLSDLVELTCLQVGSVRVHMTCDEVAALSCHAKARLISARRDTNPAEYRMRCSMLQHCW